MFEENLSYVTQKVLEGGKCKTLQDCEKFPRFINLETINNCTARCVMCGIDEWRKNITQPYMKDELFFKIADEIIENKNSVQKVALFVGNEPFLDQNLPQRVKYLTGGGIKVSLTSNGSLMNEKIAREIFSAKLAWINFSIDGLDKTAYEKIRKGLSFEEVLGNVIQFIMLRNQLNAQTAVRISIIKNQYYLKDMDKIIAFWEKILDKQRGDSLKIDDLNLGITDKVKDKGLSQLEYNRENIFTAASKNPCYVLFNTMVIKTDGQVALCCVDQCRNVTLGNLQVQSIAEVWQESKKLKEIRQIHLTQGRGGFDVCKDCICWYEQARKEIK